MSRSRVIKKDDLPADLVESVALDETVFHKRRPRIPRAMIALENVADVVPSRRYNYLQQGLLPREDAELAPEPYAVPVPGPTFDADFPVEGNAPSEGTPAADEEDDEEVDPVEALREELEAEWQEKVEDAAAAAREEGREEGRAAGYEEGHAAARDELTERFEADVERLAADVARLKAEWRDAIEASTPVLLEIAVDVAEALLDAPLPDSMRGASARAIAGAIEELAGSGQLTVSLHPVDYQRLQEKGLIEQLDANHEHMLRWHPDPEHPEGDWSVESPEAVIRHYKAEILDTVHRLLGTASSDVHDRRPNDDRTAS